jgi:hypothetical protein
MSCTIMSQNMLRNGHLTENAEHVTHNLPVILRMYLIIPLHLYDYKYMPQTQIQLLHRT